MKRASPRASIGAVDKPVKCGKWATAGWIAVSILALALACLLFYAFYKGGKQVAPDPVAKASVVPTQSEAQPDTILPKPATLLQKISNGLKTLPQNAKPAVLVQTGGLSPVHKTHVTNLDSSKRAAASQGYTVLAGIISPSHDSYLRHCKQRAFIPAVHRVAMVKLSVLDSDYVYAGDWEVNEPTFVDFKAVTEYYFNTLNAATREYREANGIPEITLIYTCGSDHYDNNIAPRGFSKSKGQVCCAMTRIKNGKPKHPAIVTGSGDFAASPALVTDHSSTDVRVLLLKKYQNASECTAADQQSLEGLLHSRVLEYIEKHHGEILKSVTG